MNEIKDCDEDREFMESSYKWFNGQYITIDEQIAMNERFIRFVESDLIREALYVHYGVNNVCYYDKETGSLYSDVGDRHDIVRVGNYPTVRFFDYESFYKWFIDYEYKAPHTEEQLQRVQDFFNEHPEGAMIDFG